MPSRQRHEFDRKYYDRFYGRKRPLRRELDNTQHLCNFVCAYLQYISLPVKTVLDIGCGLGLWRDELAKHFPKARYHGVEYSDYLCEQYGWKHGSVVDYSPRRPADLVICQDTLQYLDDRQAARALNNLARLTRGALYLGIPTKADWRTTADADISDTKVFRRTAQWYRSRLARKFHNLGGGVFVLREHAPPLWELEHL